MKLCERYYHDCFGEPYEQCLQCRVKDNIPWPENPLLMTEEQFKRWKEKQGEL